ncbi:MAG TPA: hypothetical protein VD887_03905 [Allosphingosinicella sp.]|nr:hypothetical protein [Allosphingosinicella sp.]
MNRLGPALSILLLAGCVAHGTGSGPAMPAAGELRDAVIADLMVDAMFRGDTWFWSDRSRPAYDPEFALTEAVCRGSSRRAACRFTLARRQVEPGAAGRLVDRRTRSSCRATLAKGDAAARWRIRRFPPIAGGSGHSTSSLRCRPLSGSASPSAA